MKDIERLNDRAKELGYFDDNNISILNTIMQNLQKDSNDNLIQELKQNGLRDKDILINAPRKRIPEIIIDELIKRGNKIGSYLEAFKEFYNNGLILEEEFKCLKGTIFEDFLRKEVLRKKLIIKDNETAPNNTLL